jgi:hypothetical protein
MNTLRFQFGSPPKRSSCSMEMLTMEDVVWFDASTDSNVFVYVRFLSLVLISVKVRYMKNLSLIIFSVFVFCFCFCACSAGFITAVTVIRSLKLRVKVVEQRLATCSKHVQNSTMFIHPCVRVSLWVAEFCRVLARTHQLNTSSNTYLFIQNIFAFLNNTLGLLVHPASGCESAPFNGWTNWLMRFQVLRATSMKMTVFWDVALCSLVEVYRRFRGV